MAPDDVRLLLDSGIAAAGVAMPPGGLDRLERHFSLLVKWNRAVRLVGSTEARTVIERHVMESLALLPWVHQRAGSLLDIGAGNGYPAIPIKCALPELRLGMMEPTLRKSIFLETVARELQLTDTTVIRARVDRPHDLSRYGRWDCISMRAVAAARTVMAGAAAALRPGGRLLFLVGSSGRQEILGAIAEPLRLVADQLLPFRRSSFAVVLELAAPQSVPRGTID